MNKNSIWNPKDREFIKRIETICHAAEHGNLDVIQILLVADRSKQLLLRQQGFDIRAFNDENSMALNVSTYHGHLNVVQ